VLKGNKVERIRVGLIGYGVGKLYAAALKNVALYYRDIPPIDLVEVATATQKSGEDAITQFGFQRNSIDYHQVLAADDINVLVIATPNYLHKEMLSAALKTDKAIYFDKPLTNNYSEALKLYQVACEVGRDVQLILEFRYCPALQLARQMVADGLLGEIYTFRAEYYRSSYVDPDKPLSWKGSFDLSGGGVTNDYMPHLVDLVIWLVGMPTRVVSQERTFIDHRPESKGGAGHVKIDTDDHTIMICDFGNGAMGTIEAGRMIVGAKNDMLVEIRGSKGTIRWSLMDTNYLQYASSGEGLIHEGWRKIPTIQNYPDAVIPGADVPIGMMRFHIASLADFLKKTISKQAYDPNILQGVRIQAVIEAALLSAKRDAWMDVPNL
jgi:predicted dehydrogenase